MTIASAFNEIAVAQGGTASKSGAITAAIDALNDALAGSDQPQAKTIEQAVRLLGEHIGGGGGGDLPAGWYVITEDNDNILSKTWSEINAMWNNGEGWVFLNPQTGNPLYVRTAVSESGEFAVMFIDVTNPTNSSVYLAQSADDYPSLSK